LGETPIRWPGSGVYAILCRAGGRVLVYVGQSICVEARLATHFEKLEQCAHGFNMTLAYRKFGRAAFECRLLQETSDSSLDLTIWEQHWIDVLDATNPRRGFNKSNTLYRADPSVAGSAPSHRAEFWDQFPLIEVPTRQPAPTPREQRRMAELLEKIRERDAAPAPVVNKSKKSTPRRQRLIDAHQRRVAGVVGSR
jgi:GIY-YIG catalytic domain